MDVINKELRVMNRLLAAGESGMHAYAILKALEAEKELPCPSQTTVYNILVKYRNHGWLGVEHFPNEPELRVLPRSVYRIELKGIENLKSIIDSAMKSFEQMATYIDDARKRLKGDQ